MDAGANDGRKVAVLGIDGLPWSLINTYLEMGIMPQFADMIRTGALYPMQSSLPEISSVAWTSFMTGKNPGEHGIFGFMELDDRYGYRFPNFTDVKAPTLWEQNGLPSTIINLPETYPAARPLNGRLISGFVALDLNQAVYPKHLVPELQAAGYRLDVRANLAASDPEAFFDDLFTVFDKRCQTILRFIEKDDWRLFVGVITETDRLHHYFYPQTTDPGPFHERILEFYRRLDRFVGEFLARARGKNALFLTLSDHGFCPIVSEVNINTWLAAGGYLNLEPNLPGLKGMTPDSRAFCLDPGRIYIHRQNRYPKGGVPDSEYEALRRELAAGALALRFQDRPVVQKVFFREEIFTGPYQDQGPDIYLLAHPGFDLKGAAGRPDVFGRSHFTGMHTRDDAHLFISPGRDLDGLQIAEVAGIIQEHLAPAAFPE